MAKRINPPCRPGRHNRGMAMIISQIHDSISLSSSQRMVFSSIKSFTSGGRLIYRSVHPPKVYRCKAVPLSVLSRLPARLFLSPVVRTPFLFETHLTLIVQTDTGCLFPLRFLSCAPFGTSCFPVPVIAIVTGKVTDISCPLNTSKRSTTLSINSGHGKRQSRIP